MSLFFKNFIVAASFLIFQSFAEAKLPDAESNEKIKFSDEFLESLTDQQLQYLESELRIVNKSIELQEESWEDFDMDSIETASSNPSNNPTEPE